MRLLAVAIFAMSCAGCATIVTGGGESQDVRFTSKPRGARVTVDGNLIGVTPISARLTRKDDHFVVMDLGGQVKTRDLRSGVNPWIFGNILFGGIIGIIVDAASGATTWPGASTVDETFDQVKPEDYRTPAVVDPYRIPVK